MSEAAKIPRPALRIKGNSILKSREQNRTTSLDNLPRINNAVRSRPTPILARLGLVYAAEAETNTNFHVPRLKQLEQTLAVHRQSPNRKGDDQ